MDELDDDAGGKVRRALVLSGSHCSLTDVELSSHISGTLQNDLGSQAVHGDILVHSDEAPFGGEDLESAPARKRAKLSPSVEVEEAF